MRAFPSYFAKEQHVPNSKKETCAPFKKDVVPSRSTHCSECEAYYCYEHYSWKGTERVVLNWDIIERTCPKGHFELITESA